MYEIHFFKDDHNRVLRVAVNQERSDDVQLHLVQDNGSVVPLPESQRPHLCALEKPFEYDRLRTIAKVCPLFKH